MSYAILAPSIAGPHKASLGTPWPLFFSPSAAEEHPIRSSRLNPPPNPSFPALVFPLLALLFASIFARLHLVLHATLFLDSLLGMMTGYGVRGAFIVHSHQFRILATTNLIAAIVGVGVVISTPIEDALARRRHRNRSLHSTPRPGGSADSDGRALLATTSGENGDGSASPVGNSHRSSLETPATAADAVATELVYPDRWPTRATLLALANNPRRLEWVDAIRRAKDFRFQCEMCPKGLEPVSALEAFMRHMRAIWAEAKAEDSALEPALGAALERLALVHARMAYRVKKDGGGLTSALEEALLDPNVLAGMQRRYRAQVRALPVLARFVCSREGSAKELA